MALLEVVGLTLLAALALPAGGLAAWRIRATPGAAAQSGLRTVVAVGGGLLFAAVALVLVPEGLAALPLAPALACLLGGAGLMLLLDRALAHRGDSASQVTASALDSVPESLGLGAAFAAGGHVGPVLVVLVALQNLPEGFNGFRELRSSGVGRGKALAVLASASLLDPFAAAAGYLWLGAYPALVAGLFLAAAGGILYLLVQDIAPLAHKDGHWAPALGAVAGFALGIAAQAVVG
ncbi:MAG TPA: divalent cation transporter [Candidatus Thermoplasmatota archaeon]|nr:divalent cation transporter [Candidatus Thermoplasmatota archaeon]